MKKNNIYIYIIGGELPQDLLVFCFCFCLLLRFGQAESPQTNVQSFTFFSLRRRFFVEGKTICLNHCAEVTATSLEIHKFLFR